MARPVAIVVQRYGADLVGGSEALAREYAERLLGRGFTVTVYTTTARDYVTWRSEYSAGESTERGVSVRRFVPAHERDLKASMNWPSPCICGRRRRRRSEPFSKRRGRSCRS
jgi:hypothetical protein